MKTTMRIVVAIWVTSMVAMVGTLLFYSIRDNLILLIPTVLLATIAYNLIKMARDGEDRWE